MIAVGQVDEDERSPPCALRRPPGADGGHVTRVVYCWPYTDWGGVQVYFLNLIRAAGNDFRPEVMLPRSSSETLFSYLRATSATVTALPAHSDSSIPRGLQDRLRRRLAKQRVESVFRSHLLAKASPLDIFHVDFAPWTSHRFLTALARQNHTFVTLHTRLPTATGIRRSLWRGRWQRLLSMPHFHVLTANQDVRESLSEFISPEALDRVAVAYSGVDLAEIDASAAAITNRRQRIDHLGLPHGRLLVTAAGQFIERKGCWAFLDAVRRLSTQHPELFFVWFGTDKLSEHSRRRVRDLNLDGSFKYIPSSQSGETRPEFLGTLNALTDIFVLPSVLEGLPLVLVEVMAMGKPVISTRINGIPEAVQHQRNGLLITPGNIEQLTESIRTLANAPHDRERLGSAARRTAEAKFDQRLTTQTTFAAYRKALSSTGQQVPPASAHPRSRHR